MGRVRTVGLRKIDVVVAAAGTAVPISPTRLFVTDFTVHIKNANAGANIYIGDSTVDNTWIPWAKGSTINFTHGDGTYLGCYSRLGFDLSRIFIDGDANDDAVIVQYIAGDEGE